MPPLTLPSISEVDENEKEGEITPPSPNKSPLLTTNSPRRAKFNLRSLVLVSNYDFIKKN